MNPAQATLTARLLTIRGLTQEAADLVAKYGEKT